ncbi:hypothetical protein MRX96_055726 [Rhipicephalus microplus]
MIKGLVLSFRIGPDSPAAFPWSPSVNGLKGIYDGSRRREKNVTACRADASTRECLDQLLTIKELRGIPVTAKERAHHKTSTGYIHGVDGEPVADSLLPGIKSAVPVPGAAGQSNPLQCQQCGRFGHVKESCSWPGSCIRCGRAHPEVQDYPQSRPRRVNYGVPHPADTAQCSRWQEQRKVDTILASSTPNLSRKVVAAAVREEAREARSYASAVKELPPPGRPIAAPRTRRGSPQVTTPDGTTPSQRPAVSPATFPALPAVDAAITALPVTTVAPVPKPPAMVALPAAAAGPFLPGKEQLTAYLMLTMQIKDTPNGIAPYQRVRYAG